ncbi:MAG: chemotaxis protein [Syntrophomonadaceae bacterium]|nr:chemotaxis protein [Syntrophomonadaceae bacterium]
MERSSILLNSGTNEVEIVEFGIQKAALGINVIKVKEIINAIEPISIPMSHPCLEGIIQLRGDIIPVIDLAKFLNFTPSVNFHDDKYIVAEFNQSIYAFHVHSVSRIHRLSWDMIEKPTDVAQNTQNCVIGIVRIEQRMILLLDFERIMVDIAPEMGMPDLSRKISADVIASDKGLVIAEDSPMLRKLLLDYLPQIGYNNLTFFQDGRDAWKYLSEVADQYGANFSDKVSMLITDIEMPQMDGHFLTKSVKQHPVLKDLPVVIFSSLITDTLKHKGETVGADAQVSKPEYERLGELIKELCL